MRAPLVRLCREAEVPALQQCPAITLADREKAFERVVHAWFSDNLHGWQFPERAFNVACAL
eukprot:5761756-Lingulodinium_polyedra.AAC.1